MTIGCIPEFRTGKFQSHETLFIVVGSYDICDNMLRASRGNGDA